MATHARFGFAVANVKDVQKAKRFYTEVLGLKVQREAPAFVQFESFAIASDGPITPGASTELYWLVDDAEAARTELSNRGAVPGPIDTKPFGKLFSVTDPDGEPRWILELAAARPSKPA